MSIIHEIGKVFGAIIIAALPIYISMLILNDVLYEAGLCVYTFRQYLKYTLNHVPLCVITVMIAALWIFSIYSIMK